MTDSECGILSCVSKVLPPEGSIFDNMDNRTLCQMSQDKGLHPGLVRSLCATEKTNTDSVAVSKFTVCIFRSAPSKLHDNQRGTLILVAGSLSPQTPSLWPVTRYSVEQAAFATVLSVLSRDGSTSVQPVRINRNRRKNITFILDHSCSNLLCSD